MHDKKINPTANKRSLILAGGSCPGGFFISLFRRVSMNYRFAIYWLLVLISFGFLSCTHRDKENQIGIAVTPNPVSAVISDDVNRRWFFTVNITNNSGEALTIDGFSSERQGELRNHEPVYRKFDTAEVNTFGQGSRWEYKGEKVPSKGAYEIRGGVFEHTTSGIYKGSEKRVYRFRKDSGELLTANVTIELLPENN